MAKQNEKIAELTYLFRIMQLIHEVDSIDKIYRMLISFCTCGRVIGCRRAILFTIDRKHQMLRGAFGLERTAPSGQAAAGGLTFEEMAREVFDGFEKVERTDLSIHAKTFNVPLDWHRSALVKAVRSSYPVFAEGRLSEFATDPYFTFFDTVEYVALPLRTVEPGGADHDRDAKNEVTAVLAADGSKEGDKIGVERISLLYSLVQQAALAIHNLKEFAECDRRFRVLSKLNETLKTASGPSQIEETVKQGMSMLCRALNGTGSILKDFSTQKTLFVKTVHSYSLDAGQSDGSIGENFESILDRAAGTMSPVQGNAAHPLLNAADSVGRFAAFPLIVQKDVIGALAVYSQKNASAENQAPFTDKDMLFLEIGAGLLAAALGTRNVEERLHRSEDFLEELRSNLSRERNKSRLGEQGIEYSEHVKQELDRLKKALSDENRLPASLPALQSMLESVGEQTAQYLKNAALTKSDLRNIDLFKMVSRVAVKWQMEMAKRGIEVEIKIPPLGPRLLMDKKKIALALGNIVTSIGSALAEGDKALVECSTEGDTCRIVIADTGSGLPGDVLSRLFMPFHDIQFKDERKNALSLAGEIINLHGGEIVMKTSLSWKTILALHFKETSNKDRRQSAKDRRTRTRERRASVK